MPSTPANADSGGYTLSNTKNLRHNEAMPIDLTIAVLQQEAALFAAQESQHAEPTLYGVTDGKAIGTYLEHKFQRFLLQKYTHVFGSSARGIDFPELGVDLKTTSFRQPQSSCPFQSARQKVHGLGYHLLVFVYDKTDDPEARAGKLNILHTIFIDQSKTADYQTTTGLRQIVDNNGNLDDILAFFEERMLPLDDIQAQALAEEVLTNPPELGYLTISNALQWRLQYSRVIQQAGNVSGIERL
ncbi:MAG: hypothetical protein OHK0029_24480 [Armatimonadaceae bacterium]